MLRHHYDFFAEAPHDHNYCRAAWNMLQQDLDLTDFKKVIIWSDNGLKSKENLHYFHQLATEYDINIELNYFAPYHGHSECDGHFGQGKRKMRETLGPQPLSQRKDLVDASSKLPNTSTKIIPSITQLDLGVKLLEEGVRRFFLFAFDEVHGLRCRRLTNEGRWTKQNIDYLNADGDHVLTVI